MLKTIPVKENGQPYHSEDVDLDGNREGGLFTIPVVSSIAETHGNFKAINVNVAGTTTVTAPNINGAIIITDILLSAERVNNGSVVLSFTDDTETIVIFKAVVTDAPVTIAAPLNGRWRGWKDARLELVVTLDVETSASVGYYKVKDGLPFSDWDARR
jgi:hypothetical protein